MGSKSKRPPKPEASTVKTPSTKVEPRVVLVGGPSSPTAALAQALARRRVSSSPATLAEVHEVASETAPDWVVALDEATQASGSAVMAELGRSPGTSVIPVVLVTDEPGLGSRLSAYRHGVCAVIKRQASVDAIAEEVAQVVRSAPDRSSQGQGVIGEVTLEDFVATLSKQLRTGILSVRPRRSAPAMSTRLVLGAGRPVSELIDDFVRRLKGHVLSAEPIEYEFDERAMGTIALVDGTDPSAVGSRPDLGGLRVLLADDDPARADAVAQELRRAGATVMVTDLSPTPRRFTRLRELDPAVLLVGSEQLQGPGYKLVQLLRSDQRLGWASLLVVNWAEVWPEQSAMVNIDRLLLTLGKLSEPEQELAERVRTGQPFETRLESTGPARLLRALSTTHKSLRVDLVSPNSEVQVDLSAGLVVGAAGQLRGQTDDAVEGAAALAVMLATTSGRVSVMPAERPRSANLMTTVEIALKMATAEPSGTEALGSQAAADSPPRVAGRSRIVAARSLLGIGLGSILILSSSLWWLARADRGTPSQKPALSSPSVAIRPVGSQSPQNPPPKSSDARGARRTPPPAESAASLAPGASSLSSGPSTSGKDFCPGLLAKNPIAGKPPWLPGTEHSEAYRALKRGARDTAALWYCRVLDRNDGDIAAAVGLIRLLLVQRDAQIAAYWAEHALLVHPNDARLRGLLGDALALSGDEPGARKAWLQGAGVDSGDAPAVRKLALREAAAADRACKEHRNAEAERLYRRAAVLVPDDVARLLAVTRTLLGEGQARDAMQWAERATQIAPRNVVAWIMLGDALAHSGDRRQARAAWAKAQAIAPADREVQHRILQP